MTLVLFPVIVSAIAVNTPTSAKSQTQDLIVSITINTTISVLMVIAAVALGLLLRRLLIKRLIKTVLDNWVTQTLGAVVLIIPTILGLVGSLATWDLQLVQELFSLPYFTPTKLFDLGGSIIQTILIAALGYGLARTISAITVRALSNTRMDINMRVFFARIFYFIALIIAIFFILSVWDIPVAVPVAVLGTFTVTLTVALQDVLKNLLAGFYILIERPFYIGDQINVTAPGMMKYIGKVENIQLRATILRMPSGEEVSVPNIFIFSNPVINNTHYRERRAILQVSIPTEHFSRDETSSKVLAAIKQYPEVEERPEPMIMVAGYTASNIILQIRFWVKSGHTIDISDILFELHELLPTAEIAVLEPT
jgi:small-conductance mechanosensitive channel